MKRIESNKNPAASVTEVKVMVSAEVLED